MTRIAELERFAADCHRQARRMTWIIWLNVLVAALVGALLVTELVAR